MKKWLRRLRGVLGIGALWGAAGGIVGSLAGLLGALYGGAPLLQVVLEFGLGAAGLGFVLGSAFAGVLAVVERHRRFEELTSRRAALWGGLVGLVLPILMLAVSFVPELGAAISLRQLLLAMGAGSLSYGALTAGLAAATVALARRAPDELAPAEISGERLTSGTGAESDPDPTDTAI